MKTEFLRSLNLDEDVIKQIQAESGKDVTEAKSKLQEQIDSLNEQLSTANKTITQRDTDLASIQKQLEEAGQSAAKLGQVQQSLTDLQAKYDKDTKSYQEKLNKQSYEFAVRDALSGVEFSSKAAKNEFTRMLIEKNLPLQDGKLLGFTDYLEAQKKEDPTAFKAEEKQEEKGKPNFAPPPNPSENKTPSGESKFGFNFIGVRKANDE